MYEASLDTAYFLIDDVYITGYLAQKLRIKHTQISRLYKYGNIKQEFSDEKKRRTLIFGLIHNNPKQYMEIWNIIVNNTSFTKFNS